MNWHYSLALLVLSALAGACEYPDDVCLEHAQSPFAEISPDRLADGGLLPCEEVPHLCGLPTESEIREPNLEVAIDLVFVGDGYTADELGQYRQRVAELVAGVREDPNGILVRDPELFNIHRVPTDRRTAAACCGQRGATRSARFARPISIDG